MERVWHRAGAADAIFNVVARPLLFLAHGALCPRNALRVSCGCTGRRRVRARSTDGTWHANAILGKGTRRTGGNTRVRAQALAVVTIQALAAARTKAILARGIARRAHVHVLVKARRALIKARARIAICRGLVEDTHTSAVCTLIRSASHAAVARGMARGTPRVINTTALVREKLIGSALTGRDTRLAFAVAHPARSARLVFRIGAHRHVDAGLLASQVLILSDAVARVALKGRRFDR